MKIDKNLWELTNTPEQYQIEDNRIVIITKPHTDLWQRTYYHFRNDNAPMLQIKPKGSYEKESLSFGQKKAK